MRSLVRLYKPPRWCTRRISALAIAKIGVDIQAAQLRLLRRHVKRRADHLQQAGETTIESPRRGPGPVDRRFDRNSAEMRRILRHLVFAISVSRW